MRKSAYVLAFVIAITLFGHVVGQEPDEQRERLRKRWTQPYSRTESNETTNDGPFDAAAERELRDLRNSISDEPVRESRRIMYGVGIPPASANISPEQQVAERYLELAKERVDFLIGRGRTEEVRAEMKQIEAELEKLRAEQHADERAAGERLKEANDVLVQIIKQHPKSQAAQTAKQMLKQQEKVIGEYGYGGQQLGPNTKVLQAIEP